jgi:ech hydrogenase subunit D
MKGVIETDAGRLHGQVSGLQCQGHRLVTITCLDAGDAHEVLYHFDKDYVLTTLRLLLPRGQPLPSISNLFFAAALVENEIQDLFGIPVTGLAIDYQGRFLLAEAAPRAPLNKSCGMGVDVRQRPAAAPAEGPA